MPLIIGLLVVFVIILYKRSTEIILVNPLHGARTAARVPSEDEQSVPDFARLLNTMQTAAETAGANPATAKGRAAIVQLVRNNQFIEAMQLYRRLYGVDLQTAKKAIDKMMLEQ